MFFKKVIFSLTIFFVRYKLLILSALAAVILAGILAFAVTFAVTHKTKEVLADNADNSETVSSVPEVSSALQAVSSESVSSTVPVPKPVVVKPSTGSVFTAPEFAYDAKEDAPVKAPPKQDPAPPAPSVTIKKLQFTATKKVTKKFLSVTNETDVITVDTLLSEPKVVAFKAVVGTSYEVTDTKYVEPGGDSSEPAADNTVYYYTITDGKTEGIIFPEGTSITEKQVDVPIVPDSTETNPLPDGTYPDGWNRINGDTYFYHEGKPVYGFAEISGIRYHFNEKSGIKDSEAGIDVSSHQGTIDWNKVKTSGIDFCYIRVGYRGYVTGKICIDPNFKKNIEGAKRVGIRCGAYFYSVAKDVNEAAEEAGFVLAAIKGYSFDLPVYIDTEHTSDRVAGLTKTQRTDNAIVFMTAIKNGGYKTGIYTYFNYYNNYLESSRLKNYTLWIAYYTENYTKVQGLPYVCWQYSSSGTIAGISGRVDMNIEYKNTIY